MKIYYLPCTGGLLIEFWYEGKEVFSIFVVE